MDTLKMKENATEEKGGVIDPQAFQVVLKGGSPWGFTLKGGIEVQAPLQISQIEPTGKAAKTGKLKQDDFVLSINHVNCQSLTESVQLIQDAFRTLTLTVWRGTSKLESSVKILRSSSFLQRAREVQERERQRLGLQDDSIVHNDSKMRQRTRRIESFHGRSNRLRHSSSSTSTSSQQEQPSPRTPLSPRTPDLSYHHDDQGHNKVKLMENVGKEKLKGWGTFQDLSQKQKNLSNSSHDSSSTNQNAAYKSSGFPSPAMSSSMLNMTDQLYSNQGNRQPPSPRLHMKAGPDDTDNFKQTGSTSGMIDPRTGLSYPAGYHRIGWSSQMGNKENLVQTGYNAFKTSEELKNSNSDLRRSLPTPQMKPYLHDYQNIGDFKSSLSDADYKADLELQKISSSASTQNYDPRPMCSPPAPPVRDVSSMKAVHLQTHEKYPSWPVTQPSLESEGPEPISSPKFHPQLGTVKERNNSPSSDRKGDDYKRNASDPGFKKTYPFRSFIKRPKPSDGETKTSKDVQKENEEKMDNFFNSMPGYPQPHMDQDGHRIGDEKYSVPSPPEREEQSPDTKTLSEKIASIVRPHHDVGYSREQGYNVDQRRRSDRRVSPHRHPVDNKMGDVYSRGGASTNDSSQQKGQTLVDTSTSPLQSPTTSKFMSPNSASQLFNMPKEKLSESVTHNRSYIVKQMVCYNTGTQTEAVQVSPNKDSIYPENSIQARTSSESEKEHGYNDPAKRNVSRNIDVRRSSSRADRYNGNDQRLKENRKSVGDNEELSPQYNEYPASMAPMLRKLTHEYYRDRLHKPSSDKRLSSSSSQESNLRSPGSDYPLPFSQYGGMREAESYNSVVIHPDGNSSPLGRDYQEIRSSVIESHHDFGTDGDRNSNMSTEPKSSFKPGRHSLDPSMISPKYPLITTASKSLQDSRYSSEANLQSPSHSGSRDHTRSMMSLSSKHSKSSSVSETVISRASKPSFESSPPSHPQSSSDTRSSASSHYSSDSSPYVGQGQGQDQVKSRRESTDSVFVDSPSYRGPLTPEASPGPKRPSDLNVQPPTRAMGRTASMKKAYGTYDDFERSMPSVHRRQESDLSSNASQPTPTNAPHVRSLSQSDYLPMDQYRRMQMENPKMTLIREDSSEMKWEEVVRKSRNGRNISTSSSEKESNYANVDIHKQGGIDGAKLEGYQHVDSYNRARNEGRSGANLKRTNSEQVRPMKERNLSERSRVEHNLNNNNSTNAFSDKKDAYPPNKMSNVDQVSSSRSDLRPAPHLEIGQRLSSGSDNNSIVSSAALLTQNVNSTYVQSHPQSLGDLQQRSDGLSKETEGRGVDSLTSPLFPTRPGSDSNHSNSHSPNSDSSLKAVQRNAVQDYIERVTKKKLSDSGEEDQSASKDAPLFSDVEKSYDGSKLTPTESFRQKYGHRAERAESLRRSRSITSKDSSEYMEMKKPEKPHPQTEWSRIRSQTGGSRPHSIGSDSSLVDPYAVTLLSPLKDFPSDKHQRSQSDSISGSQLLNGRLPSSHDQSATEEEDCSSNLSKSALIYQNVGYRRPPPVPATDDDAPPALPPRNYRIPSEMPRYPPHSRDSVGSYDHGGDPNRGKPRYESTPPDNYAEQLRQRARRLSEQQHMPPPPPMSYITSKVKINYSQTHKRLPVEALEAKTPGDRPEAPAQQSHVTSSISSSHMSQHAEHVANHVQPLKIETSSETRKPPTSPSSWRVAHTLPSPDPPPPPTPQKEDLTHIPGVDLPPPPPELVDSKEEPQYEEDSYGSYRNRSSRQPGVYKRSASSGDALKLLRENNNYKQQAEITKPPRKKLQQPGWKSEQDVNVPEQNEEKVEPVPSFTAVESAPIQVPPRSIPRPLGHSQSTSYLFAPKPYNSPETSQNNFKSLSSSLINERSLSSNQITDRNSVPDQSDITINDNAERTSVRDRINQINNKPSPNHSDRGGKPNFINSVGHIKKNFEEQPWSVSVPPPELPPSRRSFEPPTSRFVSRQSDSVLTRHSRDNAPQPEITTRSPEMARSFAERQQLSPHGPLSPRRTSYPIESKGNIENIPTIEKRSVPIHEEVKLSEQVPSSVPPPIDRSAASGYPGSIHRRDSFQNRRSHSENKSSIGEVKRVTNSQQIEQIKTDTKSNSRTDNRNLDESGEHNQSFNSYSSSESRSGSQEQNETKSSKSVHDKNSSLSSSQPESANTSNSSTNVEYSHNRQPSAEELECDAKVQEFADQYKDKDPTLSTVLKTNSVNRMQYMDGLFKAEKEIQPRHSPKTSPKTSSVSQNSSLIENGDVRTPSKEDQEKGDSQKIETSPLPDSYWKSSPKAMMEINIRQSEDMGKIMTEHIADPDTLNKTKEELVDSIKKKMDKLREERENLLKDIEENENLGNQVQNCVEEKCRNQQEKDKYKQYVDDMEKIILLLLKVTGLLARAQNACQSLPDDANEKQKKLAFEKKDHLSERYEAAKSLKEDIDKRREKISNFLRESFCDEEMDDYNHFIQMKSKLTIEKQEIDDKLTLGNEQIQALKQSIPGKH